MRLGLHKNRFWILSFAHLLDMSSCIQLISGKHVGPAFQGFFFERTGGSGKDFKLWLNGS